MKIALLIPCTSNNRSEWNNINDTYLYNLTLKTFLLTMNKEHEYVFYIGYDESDRIFSNKKEQDVLHNINKAFNNINFIFVKLNVEKGYLTKMWNILFKQAHSDNCEYFYQCGDDIHFHTKGWVNDCITILKSHKNIGISGPINNNQRILTQAMFCRTHMDIFGFLFPESIKNWCCDDWYNWTYQPNYFFPMTNHFCSNNGGQPRYVINNDINFKNNFNQNTEYLRKQTYNLAIKHRQKIIKYVKHNNKLIFI